MTRLRSYGRTFTTGFWQGCGWAAGFIVALEVWHWLR